MFYVGIDFGGTNIKAGAINENGRIICKGMIKTEKSKTYRETVNDIVELIKGLFKTSGLDLSEIASIGMGVPGTCDSKRGLILLAENIGYEYVPMADEIKKYFDVPVYITNDANCAAYGEYSKMDDKADDVVFVTLGTGIGGGIILNGKIFEGKNGTAGEIGHIPIEKNGEKCNCGMTGCWERYASVSALVRMTERYAQEHPGSGVAKKIEFDGAVSGKTAFSLAKEGDEGGRVIVSEWIKNLSQGIITVINMLQPEYIIIGGGISREGDYILNPLLEEIKKDTYYNSIENKTKIITAKLFNDAGFVGAALLGKGEID
ncbi:MAG: ROK family protein [Clostridia bacterium]|nr:ROK family protein [Clostridia bacterium]